MWLFGSFFASIAWNDSEQCQKNTLVVLQQLVHILHGSLQRSSTHGRSNQNPTPDPDLNATNWKSPRQIKGPGQNQLGTKTQQSSDNIRHMSHQTRMLSYSRSWQVTECHSTACLSFCNSSKASEPCARPASSKA